MTAPTPEEVALTMNKLRWFLEDEQLSRGGIFKQVERISDAYLAQAQELIDERLRRKQEYWEARETIDKLEAENQALQERLTTLGIERMQWRQENTIFRHRMNTAEQEVERLKSLHFTVRKGEPARYEVEDDNHD